MLQIMSHAKCDFLSPRWNMQYITSIPFIHGCSGGRGRRLRERWRKKSFENRTGRHRKCITSASPTPWKEKYKCTGRCGKKQWVFSLPFIPCCPSGFLLLRSPYQLQRWSFSRGARRLMYHSESRGEGGCSKRKQSETVRTPENVVRSHQEAPRWWMKGPGPRVCHSPVARVVKEHLYLFGFKGAF